MDFVGKLVSDTNCNMDGTISSNNPFSSLIESAMERHVAPIQTSTHAVKQANWNQEYEKYSQQQRMENTYHTQRSRSKVDNTLIQNGAMENAFGGPMQPYQQPMMHRMSNQPQHYVHRPQQHFMHRQPHPNSAMQQPHPNNTLQQPHPNNTLQQPHLNSAMQQPLENNTMQQNNLKGSAAGDIAQRMEADPRMRDSSFLGFVKDVDAGNVVIKENQVLDREGNVVNDAEEQWKTTTKEANFDSNSVDMAWQEKSNLEKAWYDAEQYQGGHGWEDELFDQTGYGVDEIQEYTLSKDNPYQEQSNQFEEGMRLFKAGDLDNAILAFQADVEMHDQNSEGWRMLGECHAEHDEDKKAIACLQRAIDRDAYNLNALLSLGVSHVNELDSMHALHTLKAWIQHNPKFHGLVLVANENTDGNLMSQVMQLMLQAQSYDPTDIDVQTVLGVLYNVSKDYQAAAKCFRLVMQNDPTDYTVWNKLGATLANSNQSDEAIPAYHRAIEIKPKYARGWLNLGISHANLGEYKEASRCYLQAISLNKQAKHVWNYLRIAFSCMDRFDLVKLTDTQDASHFSAEFPTLSL